MTARQDRAETINSILRNGGVALHYHRAEDAGKAAEAINLDYDLAVVFSDENPDLLPAVIDARDRGQSKLTVISCRESIDPDQLSADIIAGAADLVAPSQRQRLFRVFQRELRAARLGRALREAVGTAASYREQLKTFMAGSADAIAHVQEGVVLDANPAWTQLFGRDDMTTLLGTPIMDLFATESHASLKGALVACTQGRWPTDPLRCTGVDINNSQLSLELNLEQAQFEGEPCVRISIAPTTRDDGPLLKELREAVNRDPATGLFTRKYLIERLEDALAQPLKGGLRGLAIIRPDAFGNVVETVGSRASELVIQGMADILKDHVQPSDVYGRFGGTLFAVLLPRGNTRDMQAWSESFCRKVGAKLFELSDKSLSVTCTVGLATIDESEPSLDLVISQAMEACQDGRSRGGDQVAVSSANQATTEIEDNDRLWVPRIKQALIDQRFRLAPQPIASLAGSAEGIYDVLVRMIDEQGDDILPGQFMPAAERNQLVKNIDRWVLGATVGWCRDQSVNRAFVRLSQPTVTDDTLVRWLLEQVEGAGIGPDRLVLQVPEIVADRHLKATRDMAEELRSLGFGFAIEHFGVGSRPMQVLNHVPMEFLKIDGSLMQGMAREPHLQAKLGDLVSDAREKGIATIAERVEDANTMAVLWQLGVEYIQGYQVQEPEVVLAEDPPAT
ncbi:MAG: EAL domain-containing protein [Gammaproteobacteria bacterium]